jgi:hypothetical protein
VVVKGTEYLYARYRSKKITVDAPVPTALGDHLIQPSELCPSHSGQKVAHAIVVANVSVLIVDYRLPRLCGQIPRAGGNIAVSGE